MDCRSLLLPAVLAAATAWGQSATDPGKTARCATRLSVAFLGQTPTSAMLAQANPQSQIATLMKDPAFVERFASFINATFNSAPAAMPEQDAAYWLTKVILTANQPWK
jgi:hypothetical protein